jgi:alpha-maltose-1-phosphate synthase
MRELNVFVGGSTGSDPYSPRTWSGSSPFFIKALDQAGLLDKAVGLKLPSLQNYSYLAKNFTPDRAVWRKHFYFDPAYRRALTRTARAIPVDSPFCLQIGHMFSLPDVFPNRKCISYHDGNLSELLNSGFGIEGVSRKRIDQALRYEEEAAQQMTAVFTFSEYLRESFIRDYRVPAERVFNVGGAVNFAEIPAVTPNKDYTLNRLLFIGTEFTRKGGPQLLEAFAVVRQAIPTAELHIAGPHTLDNIPPGVVFHGHLSKADPAQSARLEDLFRTSTLFALPSLYEPFGIAPLEAMLYGLPAIVTNAWALRECVTPSVNGDLAEKGNAQDLAAKITQLLSDPTRLAVMGQQAREIVLTRYTWPAVASRISQAVKSL